MSSNDICNSILSIYDQLISFPLSVREILDDALLLNDPSLYDSFGLCTHKSHNILQTVQYSDSFFILDVNIDANE